MRTAGFRPLALAASAAGALCVVFASLPALAGCPPEPRPQDACQSFEQTSLSMDAAGRFDWKASRGPESKADQFVSSESSYQLCAWDEDKLVVAADIPAGAECHGEACWSSRSADARRYFDDCGVNGDIHLLDLTAADPEATKLHAVTVVVGGIILPVDGGLIVQLVNNDTQACFESFAPADSFTMDDKAAFAAKFTVTAPD